MHANRQTGFTIVEIALVLIILGLLIGGVFKGYELIINTKLKRLQSDYAGISATMFSYQDRYTFLPGDDDNASFRFTLYTDGLNDPAPIDINGDGDGSIDGDWLAAPNTETANFWKHLRAAALIPGDDDDNRQPTNAQGGGIGVRNGSLLIAGHVLVFGSLSGEVAKIMENRQDDGLPASGNIQSDLTAALMNGSVISSVGANYLDAVLYFAAFNI